MSEHTEQEAIVRRMGELDLAYGAPSEIAHNIAVAVVVNERAIDRLTAQMEMLVVLLGAVVNAGEPIYVRPLREAPR